jgi:hypothetical protein
MNHRNKFRFRFWPAIPFLFVGAGLLMGGVVKLLWNAILPPLLNVKPIAYWQAVGLLALCRILFGNYGGGRRRQRWSHGMADDNPDSVKRTGRFGGLPWRNKWMNMSPEERIKFRSEMRRRCKPPENE